MEMTTHSLTRTSRYLTWAALVALLLVAATIRFTNISAQSLWYDEGTTVGRAMRDIPTLIETMQANIHVPGYFILIGIWEDIMGNSEFALRSFSAFFSLMSIAVTYALGRRLFGRIAAISAVGFVTFNTLSIYYAQEARMYSMLAAVVALSMYIFVRLVDQLSRPSPETTAPWWKTGAFKWGLALALINGLGMYTHYFFPLIMLVQGIMAVLWLGLMAVRNWREKNSQRSMLVALATYTIANLVTLALFIPWAPIALRQITGHGNPSLAEPETMEHFLRQFHGVITFGTTFEVSMGGMGIAIYLLLIFGLLMVRGVGKRDGRDTWRLLLPIVWVVATLIFFLVLKLNTRYLRFLTPTQIAIALWMGRGIAVLWHIRPREQRAPMRYIPRFAGVFTAFAIMVTMFNGLDPLYNDPDYRRDDYRGLVQQIEDALRPGDGIIVSAPGVAEIVGYYYHGDAPIYPLPTSDDTVGDIERILAQHSRIFVVYYGTRERDPDGSVEGTLNAQAYQISDQWVDDMRLVRYVAPIELDTFTESGMQFGEHITLERYALSSETVTAGDALQLQLEWTTDTPLEARYKVFVQLLNPDGTLAAQRDSEPGGGDQITTIWQPGETIIDRHALAIPDDLPEGDGYTLILGLYDANPPNDRLLVGENDHLVLAEITVER
ncbi:MAG: glycosyltransferase family 39 protein [Anaerolineaceae bacterium]|nr:glycosyltransferase family 39 protein [Anaerolineaceae bacterium]